MGNVSGKTSAGWKEVSCLNFLYDGLMFHKLIWIHVIPVRSAVLRSYRKMLVSELGIS